MAGGGGGGLAESCLTLATTWTVACQTSLSMGFPRQEYWSELPFPSPGALPDPGFESVSLIVLSPVLAGGYFSTSASYDPTLSSY